MARQMQDAYIVAATRTPVGKAPRGAFKHTRPDSLLAHVKNKLVDPKEAYMMSVNKTEFAGLLAREGLKTGLPETV